MMPMPPFRQPPITRPPGLSGGRALLAVLALACAGLQGASPKFHEAQTRAALRLIPRGMGAFLEGHVPELIKGAQGQFLDQVPTVEEVEGQFQHIVDMSEQQYRTGALAKELGVLAHQIQLLSDPSTTHGTTLLRDQFQAYGDEKLAHLVAVREGAWALRAPLDPRPALVALVKLKYERHRLLMEHFDEQRNRRIGPWDDLSVPYAQLQLSYSSGANATAAFWTLLWRAVGDRWDPRAQ
jgi:hypothetical protein